VLLVHGEATAVALAEAPLRGGGLALCGLDPVWGYARPVVGPDPVTCAGALVDVLDRARWHAAVVTGIRPGGAFGAELVARLARSHRLQRQGGMACQVVSLADGIDAWLTRRSARFRKNLRQAARRAEAAGLTVELVRGGGAELVDRAIAVERRSWKGRRGSGLVDPGFARFYRHMARRLAPTGRLRAGFARADGTDVAYILGAVRGADYRGLQLSFDEGWAPWSLGNVLQLAQMTALVAEGVTRYDLGMEMAYKRSWADESTASETLVVLR
jgi:CelD/BcsL family acetyltransferase involved in cellulose biosynthesis